MELGSKAGAKLNNNEIESLMQKMIKGVAGCEHGCPADAKSLVYTGFKDYKLTYTDGGILSASCVLKNNETMDIKIFPGF
ncbi:hypothetical protein MCHI_000109 [Candidatus Magnetoovum chiemensis]|nr:hypothetical protein MCHI_000109 [Candidatus Magnetoovum chiemensis]